MERHLADDRLHIVAAPGAGKTTLGLEIFRRLGRPALVLAPTLTIRDQWLLRLGDFLPESNTDGVAEWTSTDVLAPSCLTVATYQALLARHRADESDPAGSVHHGMPSFLLEAEVDLFDITISDTEVDAGE